MPLIIRKATAADIKAITEIYNEAILNTDATFDMEPKTIAEQEAWFDTHGPKNPVLVAEIDGVICGWASLSQWSTRCAYTDTAEISLYVKQAYHRQGIGKYLMETALSEGKRIGLHTILSRITSGNEISIHLHQQFGFEHIGTMKEVGKKFGRMLDVCMLQKIYRP
jgi:L-amino acid N-acyltransferase YncA